MIRIADERRGFGGRLSSRRELEQLVADDRMLDTIILILKRAINNETWASINWQLPSPLNALALLTINNHNVAVVLAHFLLACPQPFPDVFSAGLRVVPARCIFSTCSN